MSPTLTNALRNLPQFWRCRCPLPEPSGVFFMPRENTEIFITIESRSIILSWSPAESYSLLTFQSYTDRERQYMVRFGLYRDIVIRLTKSLNSTYNTVLAPCKLQNDTLRFTLHVKKGSRQSTCLINIIVIHAIQVLYQIAILHSFCESLSHRERAVKGWDNL